MFYLQPFADAGTISSAKFLYLLLFSTKLFLLSCDMLRFNLYSLRFKISVAKFSKYGCMYTLKHEIYVDKVATFILDRICIADLI
jgi:hypothetical protein